MPSRIRVDNGGENELICQLMLLLRGSGRGSVLRGASVHNQRIERLWLDVWLNVLNVYHTLFTFLETDVDSGGLGILNSANDMHLWCLHYIFLPRINAALEEFRQQWNNHGIRTESYFTPNQIFIRDSIRTRDIMYPTFQSRLLATATNGEASTFRINRVIVPQSRFALNSAQMETFQRTFDPLTEDDASGAHIFADALHFLENLPT